MRQLFLSTMIVALLAQYASAQSIIPFVEKDSEIWIVNGDVGQFVVLDLHSAQSETLANRTVVQEKTATTSSTLHYLEAWELLNVKASDRGYVHVRSALPVHAWSVVSGTTFPASSVNGSGVSARVFSVTEGSAIAIVNPHDVWVRATFYMFTDRGVTPEAYRNWEFGPGASLVGFFKDRIASPTCIEIAGTSCGQRTGFTVVVSSEKPLGISVAKCKTAPCESVPVAVIR